MTVDTALLPGAKITGGPQAWQVLQRDADGAAPLTLEGRWAGADGSVVEVRVAREYDNAAAPGCDWRDAEMLPDNGWRCALRVPTGGLYKAETRVRVPGVEWRNTGDKIWHLAVGDLWVITGQSNAVGYGHGAVVDPPMLGVSLCGGNEEWRLATHPLFDPTDTKHPANRDGGWVDVSPWLAFAKGILDGAGVPVGLIPTALGGSPLSAWDPDNGDAAVLYHNMVSHIDAAGGKVAGMVWYQGESDASAELNPTYLARFTRFVEAFRTRYGAELPVLTTQLNRYFDSSDEEQGRQWAIMRETQRQAAKVIPRVAVVPTLDLGLSDAIHTSAAGNVVLGERFARVALGMVYGQPLNWQPVDAREARFTNAERTALAIAFDGVTDHLVLLTLFAREFGVEDVNGAVPVAKAWVEEPNVVRLDLGRAAGDGAVCHLSVGCNPPSTLRDTLQRPALAFYGLEIQAL